MLETRARLAADDAHVAMVPMPSRSKRNAAGDAALFAALAEGQGVGAACRQAGYVRRCVYRWRVQDAAFAAAWSGALQRAGAARGAETDRAGDALRRDPAALSRRELLARLKAIPPQRITLPTVDGRLSSVVLLDIMLEHVVRRLSEGEDIPFSQLSRHLQEQVAASVTRRTKR